MTLHRIQNVYRVLFRAEKLLMKVQQQAFSRVKLALLIQFLLRCCPRKRKTPGLVPQLKLIQEDEQNQCRTLVKLSCYVDLFCRLPQKVTAKVGFLKTDKSNETATTPYFQPRLFLLPCYVVLLRCSSREILAERNEKPKNR